MRILVCGGRNYGTMIVDNRTVLNPKEINLLCETLDNVADEFSEHYNSNDNWLPTDITIIAGKASGADTLAADWAIRSYAKLIEFPANWKLHGRSAGPIRNRQMLEEGKPELVIAFPGGRGTANMCDLAESARVEVRRIGWHK